MKIEIMLKTVILNILLLSFTLQISSKKSKISTNIIKDERIEEWNYVRFLRSSTGKFTQDQIDDLIRRCNNSIEFHFTKAKNAIDALMSVKVDSVECKKYNLFDLLEMTGLNNNLVYILKNR